jgi:5-methylcytosine-specific restriction endonuclease McrA
MLTEAQRRRAARKIGQMGCVSTDYEIMLWRLQHGRCFHCAEPLVTIHVDHLRPLGIGGLHDDGNLALSCATCNLGRPKHEDAGPGPLCYTMEGV